MQALSRWGQAGWGEVCLFLLYPIASGVSSAKCHNPGELIGQRTG